MNYQNKMAEKAVMIKPSGIRRYFDLAAEMEDCIVLGVGEPDFKTPEKVREAAKSLLDSGNTSYSSNSGMPELCTEICQYMERRFQVSYDPKTETLVTVGGSEAIDLCIRALVNPGEEVLIPDPCYVSYSPMAEMAGGVAVSLPVKAENGFRLTGAELAAAITPRTKLLVLPFPCNPTGAVMRREHLEELAAVLKGTDIFVLSDEIYAELTYGGERHVSFAAIDGMKERTILISGFSKAYAMTGWRLGYACGPEAVIELMTKIHQFAIMCAPVVSQYAAITALKECDEDIAGMCRDYDERRRLMVGELNRMGLSCVNPEGAFYVFPCIRSTGLSSEEFCERLLKEKRTAVIPGNAFGASGEGFVRISYSYSLEHLQEGLRRIEGFLVELAAEKNEKISGRAEGPREKGEKMKERLAKKLRTERPRGNILVHI